MRHCIHLLSSMLGFYMAWNWAGLVHVALIWMHICICSVVYGKMAFFFFLQWISLLFWMELDNLHKVSTLEYSATKGCLITLPTHIRMLSFGIVHTLVRYVFVNTPKLYVVAPSDLKKRSSYNPTWWSGLRWQYSYHWKSEEEMGEDEEFVSCVFCLKNRKESYETSAPNQRWFS